MDINIAIIEDHVDYLDALSYVIDITEGFECVGKYGSVEEALVSDLSIPDVVLIDINLPGMSGIEGLKAIKKINPELKIIMLTVYDDDSNIFNAILNGADGYILKKTSPQRVLQGVEDVYQGGAPICPLVARKTLDLLKEYAPKMNKESILSPREVEVLWHIGKGRTNEEVAEVLFISLETVRNHIRHIYQKLHVHSKSQAILKAIREGII